MRIKLLIIIFLSLLCNIANAQSFNYSYTDPCNGKVYNISIPYGQNQIAVTYYGQVNTFTSNDFNNGTFDNWAANVYNQYKNASPCGSIGTVATISQTQGTALNVVSILNSLSSISDAVSSGAGNILSAAGSINNVGGGSGGSSDSKSSDNNKENKNGNNSGGSTTSGGSNNGSNGGSNNTENNNGSSGSGEQNGGSGSSSGSGESGGTTNNGSGGSNGSGSSGGTTNNGSGGSGSTATSSSGSGSGSGGGSTSNQTEGSTDKKSDAIGGTTNAVKSAPSGGSGDKKSSTTDKNGTKPSILASSDLVGFQFKNGEVTQGAKINAGYTSVRYDGLRSHGFMVDYTSSIKGPNITGYYAWIKPKHVTLLANTLTVGFEGSGSLYNTVAFGQMRNLPFKFKAVYMMTGSIGKIYKEPYYGSALIAGFNRDNKIGKRIQVKTMALFVYAPFVRYYNDAVLKSPFVILPIVGANFSVTKTFKLNVNFGGAYSIGDNVLNYTVMLGTRLAL